MTSNASHWLAETWVSRTIQDSAWVIPLVQTIHILALAIALSSSSMLEVRLMLIRDTAQAAPLLQRFTPWLWRALIVLAVSGVLLVVGEPERALLNIVFWAKMAMLAAVLLVTAIRLQVLTPQTALRVPSRTGSFVLRASAFICLGLWIAVACAGRWIAYADSF